MPICCAASEYQQALDIVRVHMALCGYGQDLSHFPVRYRVGRSAHQLRVMDRNGTFPARWTATGRRYYTEADACGSWERETSPPRV